MSTNTLKKIRIETYIQQNAPPMRINLNFFHLRRKGIIWYKGFSALQSKDTKLRNWYPFFFVVKKNQQREEK